ncbi:MAG: GH92 family glycosyl hydrolase [Saprospiraceae bacterium]|nr:GH92 family glycosyl hydrolase [Saprospiraceae bacterium]
MNRGLILLVLILVFACSESSRIQSDSLLFTDYVNPFIGTGGHGHTYPGATVPFGMMQLSPDTRLEGWDGCSGYHYSDSIIYGFSHTHLSGTGVSDYGDLLLMPHCDTQSPTLEYTLFHSRFDKNSEKASPGYYEVKLNDDNIKVALSTTTRCGMHKYTFASKNNQQVMLDLQHRDQLLSADFEIVDNKTIRGFRRSNTWATDQHFYFYLQFSRPFVKKSVLKSENFGNVNGQFTFDSKEQELLVKVGMSAVSMEGAQKNLEKEIPDWDFDKIQNNATNIWNKELSKVEIEGGTQDSKTIFYTALYHSFIVPNIFMDVDGQFRGTDGKVHKTDNFDYYTIFSLWDTFRATHPLFTILQRKRTLDFIKTFLKQYEYGGQLPVWELAGNYTGCMIGYHSVSVIADAYAKGIRDFDLTYALEAMHHSATQDHLGLEYYKRNGFIACDEEAESVSKTLEYAYDDWCIAQFAKAIGNDSLFHYYIKRGQSYKNLYDPSTKFIRGRINGAWFSPFDPSEVNFNYTEANGWQYTFFVPQDISGLIDLMGGAGALEKMLDNMFEAESDLEGRHQVDITGLIGQYAHGNEPSHHFAYLYNYVHKPWKTQKRVKQIINELYQNAPDGLSGNEDCGQMSSWYNLSTMGFYAVTPGTDYYVIGSPAFEKIKLNLENGNEFIIKANNLSGSNTYVQSIKLNGRDYNKTFLKHSDIINGGEMVFEMGNTPNKKWGISNNALPSSEIKDDLIIPVPYLVASGKTFVDSMSVSMKSICKDCKIFYTIDSTEPNENSILYTQTLNINQSTRFKFLSIDKHGQKSAIMTEDLLMIDNTKKIQINSKYANQYSAGGEYALIDQLRGNNNFRTGYWQGYREDMNVIVDLGASQQISNIKVGFLQDIKAWIFYPPLVDYYTSQDGVNFKQCGTYNCDMPDDNYTPTTKDFEIKLNKNINARYIKIIAKNYGVCPEWHLGKGGVTWIFADEIQVQ